MDTVLCLPGVMAAAVVNGDDVIEMGRVSSFKVNSDLYLSDRLLFLWRLFRILTDRKELEVNFSCFFL